ncbi:MAG: HAD-IC family P-type ATPase [Ignavibacteria bacterium]|nr:HAD-IC family P-type ATPase [Ignavibacteria bacterium]
MTTQTKRNIDKVWALKTEEVLKAFATGEKGLTSVEAAERLKLYGPNEIPEKKKISPLLLFLKQFKSLLIFILLGAAAISFVIGHYTDVWVILFVVILNALIGFIQEYKAENDVASLKKMIVQETKVIRDYKLITVSTKEIVPGDVITLHEGDSIPADSRIIISKNLRTIESSLTGESVPVNKGSEPLAEDTPMADRKNMLWKGTFVAGGYAEAVVAATGPSTEIGKIASSLGEIKQEKTNFQVKTDRLGSTMAKLAFTNAFLIFTFGMLFAEHEVYELLLISIAALVSAIPEGLPAILTIVLAIGARRMAKRNAILREFTSIETLGSVTAIVTDKTGTLTQNTLTVKKIFTPDTGEIYVSGEGWEPKGNFYKNNREIRINEHISLMGWLMTALISNNSGLNYDEGSSSYRILGDPTEAALLVLAGKAGFSITKDEAERIKKDDLPFSSKHKLRATLYSDNSEKILYVIGAPEKILEKSSFLKKEGSLRKITLEDYRTAEDVIESWAFDAMRTVGLAYKYMDPSVNKIEYEDINQLIFAGLAGMIDPPRPEVKNAVNKCRSAGIRVIMATGDHKITARSIALETELIREEEKDLVLTENELEKMNENQFTEAVKKVSVFARLTPEMKLKIASELQAQGNLIAMTGDGVNDAPALKKADVGISMGIMGTDVAREASKVVLADDNFATIVNAIEEGRIVFKNARRTSFFLVTTSLAELGTLLSAIVAGFPIPLTATQILWLNLVTDGIISIPLATEKGHAEIIEEKPIPKNEPILNREVFPFALINMTVMIILAMSVFYKYFPQGIDTARTAAFTVMAFTQLFNSYNMRALHTSLFHIGFLSNRFMNITFLLSLIIQSFVIYHPYFKSVFHFGYIEPVDYLFLILASSSVIIVGELYKFFIKYFKNQNLMIIRK